MNDKERLEAIGVKDTDLNTNDFLKHHGILGMKWGIRRYQPYPKGDGHKGNFVGRKESKKKARAAGREARKDSVSKSRESSESGKSVSFRKANKEASKAYKTAKQKSRRDTQSQNRQLLKDKLKKDKVEAEKKVKNMTDDELREVLNRLNMEKQYVQITKAEKTKGRKLYDELVIKSVKVAVAGTVVKLTTDQINKILKG